MRPTGRLHLGNYMGALYNWVRLQDQYDCYFFIADLHALTTDYADPTTLRQNIRDVALDFLSAGLDPERSTIFIQSHVPQHAELHTLFSMFTPLPWLERVPTYKDQQEQLREKDLNTYGFLGYPLLQSADILLYQPDFVPVGQDQVAHVELTREVARRFNALYCSATHTGHRKGPRRPLRQGDHRRRGRRQQRHRTESSPNPKSSSPHRPNSPASTAARCPRATATPSCSSEPEADLRAKLKTMVTDPARIRRTDVGNPDVCPVFDLHKVFSAEQSRPRPPRAAPPPASAASSAKAGSPTPSSTRSPPFRSAAAPSKPTPSDVDAILWDGSARARRRAIQTLQHVRQAMGLE